MTEYHQGDDYQTRKDIGVQKDSLLEKVVAGFVWVGGFFMAAYSFGKALVKEDMERAAQHKKNTVIREPYRRKKDGYNGGIMI